MSAPETKAWHVATGAVEVGDEFSALCGGTFVRAGINRRYACLPCMKLLLSEHAAMSAALHRVADMVVDVGVILGDES